ncbi:MAG: CPBP family intramembrane metalloprotease [Clostridia bacterium]|nr:CPBP family intramembrane metalloprotease [Clostridia bacterium]
MDNSVYNYTANQFARIQEEKKGIRLIGKASGICVIAFVVIQYIVTVPILIPFLLNLYKSDTVFRDSVSIIISLLSVLVPFVAAGFYLKKRTGVEFALFSKPGNSVTALLLIFVGLFFCVAGDYVTSWLSALVRIFGFELTTPDETVATGFFPRLVYVIYVAFTAPLCEEIAIRGVVLQPLRRYGDVFAIVVSSVVFGVLHGNLVQAPFAFVVGIGLGYTACITGSLWPCIIIHSINNLIAALSLFASEDLAPEVFLSRYNMVQYTLIVLGVLSAIGFVFVKGREHLGKSQTYSGTGAKTAAFFLNVPMIIALLLMAFFTAQYVHKI